MSESIFANSDRRRDLTGYSLEAEFLPHQTTQPDGERPVVGRLDIWPSIELPHMAAIVLLSIDGVPDATWVAPFRMSPPIAELSDPQFADLWTHYWSHRARQVPA